MQVPESVAIREVGPRDGLQNEAVVPTQSKVHLIDSLAQTGIRRIEAVSFVRPDAIPQMADAAEVWAGITRRSEVEYSVLALNLRGAERAVEADADLVQFAMSASETHNLKNAGRTVDQSVLELADVVAIARSASIPVHATISTAWGCPYEGEITIDRVLGVVDAVLSTGVNGVSLGDTTGMATPGRVEQLICALLGNLDASVELNTHFHDTRGCGLANVIAALSAGCTSFDASVGGLGGCPYAPGATGNICTEDLVHMLEDMGVETGVSLENLLDVAAQAQELAGRELPSHLLKAGPRLSKTAV